MAENLGTGEIFSDLTYFIYIFFGGKFSKPKNNLLISWRLFGWPGLWQLIQSETNNCLNKEKYYISQDLVRRFTIPNLLIIDIRKYYHHVRIKDFQQQHQRDPLWVVEKTNSPLSRHAELKWAFLPKHGKVSLIPVNKRNLRMHACHSGFLSSPCKNICLYMILGQALPISITLSIYFLPKSSSWL